MIRFLSISIFSLLLSLPVYAQEFQPLYKSQRSKKPTQIFLGSEPQINPNGDAVVIQEKTVGGSSAVIFGLGSVGQSVKDDYLNELKRRELELFANDRADQVVQILDSTGQPIGTAVWSHGVLLTALHNLIGHTKLFIFSAATGSTKEVLGYYGPSTSKIDYTNDIAILATELGEPNASVAFDFLNARRGQSYVELSYPRGVRPNEKLSIHTGYITNSQPYLLTLSSGGQNFASSGGGVFELMSGELVGLTLCYPKSASGDNPVTVLSLSLRDSGAYLKELYQKSNLHTLGSMPYQIQYLKDCRPIRGSEGGR